MRSHFLNIVKYSFVSILFLGLSFFCLFHFGFLNNFSNISFDKTKLCYANTQIELFNNKNEAIQSNTNLVKNITYNSIPKNLINAFISIEDKSFFNHNGINYKRMLSASLKNIFSLKLKEGASTISQQLIKNTHLTNNKTFKRKINEILLAKKMEQLLTKEEILTSYLNAIYFGSGAFGINQASQRYFSKEIEDLNLSECATLAGIIKSPKKYSPILNYDNSIKRRNIVLKEMLKDNKINKEEYEKAIKEDINLNINKNFLGNNTYYSACIDEACNILKITEKDLLLKKYKIYTYKDDSLQDILENEINNYNKYTTNNCDCCALSIDSKTGGINAFYGKSDYELINLKRQPGSVLKPIIAYSPALENNIISPVTPILDEKININGYSPSNYKNKYYGWISAKESLSKSLNIPSIKILNYVGIDKAKLFANKLGINFDKKDNGYSIALGGLTNGLTIKEITNAYQCFSNNGKFIPAGFIKEIKNKDGKTIYCHNNTARQVIKNSTAFLITDMLRDTVVNGTSKKLNLQNTYIAAKTGTVGVLNNKENKNSDAWNISYTKENVLGIWFGSTNNLYLDKTITGGNTPTILAQSIYKQTNLGKNNDFDVPDSVTEVDLNLLEYSNNQKVLLADANTPDRYKFKSFFANTNIPKEKSDMFDTIDKFEIKANIKDNEVKLFFKAKKHLWYEIKKQTEDNVETITIVSNKNEDICIYDKNIKQGNFYTYFVVAHYNDILGKENFNTQTSNFVKIFSA